MSEIIIRDIDDEMQRRMEALAREHNRDLSEEARALLRESLGLAGQAAPLAGRPPGMGMGTWMMSLVPPEYRGDDLVFEVPDDGRPPPNFD